MRISRVLLSGAAVGTIVGTGRADLNNTHVFNPKWPPHARFHSAAGWGTVVGSQLLVLWLLWRSSGQAGEGGTHQAAFRRTPEPPFGGRVTPFGVLVDAGVMGG